MHLELVLVEMWLIDVLLKHPLYLLLVILDTLKELWGIGLLHDSLITELSLDVFDSLHVGVDNLAVLVAVTVGNIVTPLYQMKLQVKFNDVKWRDHVDEGEANALLGSQVLWKVEKVELIGKFLVYNLKDVVVAKFYRNVFNHQSRLTQNLTVVVRF